MASIGFMYVLLLLEYKNHHKSTTVLNVKNTYLTPSMPVPPPRTLSEYQKGELLVENYNHSNHSLSEFCPCTGKNASNLQVSL